MNKIEIKAKAFAERKHREINHLRKYTGEPYIVHPVSVAEKVKTVNHTNEMVCAALLHDTVEDTKTTMEEIVNEFGPAIAELVESLTDVAVMSDGNRATRMQINLEHTAKGSSEAHTIKLADLIDNSHSIIKHDPSFAKLYMKEKRALMAVLGDGEKVLYEEANKLIEDWENANN